MQYFSHGNIIIIMAAHLSKEKLRRAGKVFFTSFFISSVAFGGGFVVLPMLRKTYVDKYKWVSDEDMDNYIALAQACPGTIAGNTTMLIGFQVAGLLGAIFAMLASIIPPLVIITVLSVLYHSFMEILLFVLGFCLAFLTDISVIFIILGAMVLGIIYTYIKLYIERKKAGIPKENTDKQTDEQEDGK